MEKHVKNYDTFTTTNPTSERLARASTVNSHEVSEENKTEAEKLKDEKVEEIERESDAIDASIIAVDEKSSNRFIQKFGSFTTNGK